MGLMLSERGDVVTGGSRGLGRAGAEALVADGARVVVSSRSADAVAEAARDLGGDERAIGVAADLGEPGAAQRLVDAATATYGRLDGALVSVGGPPGGSALDVGDDQWRSAFESVFVGAVRMVRTLAGALADGGSIALVLSTSVRSPIEGLDISNGLRPGLGMLGKAVAAQVGPRGIRVNALMPGRIATDRIAELEAASGDPAAARRAAEERIPLRRLGDPAEFGRVAAFVLSPAASYVTGSVWPVDGGVLRTQ